MALAPSGPHPAVIEPTASTPLKTLSAARDLLASLQPGIKAILDDGGRDRRLKVKLNRMDIMKPERQKGMEGTYGRVLWIGPDNAEEDKSTRRLREVCSTFTPIASNHFQSDCRRLHKQAVSQCGTCG